jgi:hypothetical protein
METVLANKISKLFLNLSRTQYSNPFINTKVLQIAKKLNIVLVPKSMGYNDCAPLGFYENRMCEIILSPSNTNLTDEEQDHLKNISNNWRLCPHLLYVNPSNNKIIEIIQYKTNKRKRSDDLVEIPDSTWIPAESY